MDPVVATQEWTYSFVSNVFPADLTQFGTAVWSSHESGVAWPGPSAGQAARAVSSKSQRIVANLEIRQDQIITSGVCALQTDTQNYLGFELVTAEDKAVVFSFLGNVVNEHLSVPGLADPPFVTVFKIQLDVLELEDGTAAVAAYYNDVQVGTDVIISPERFAALGTRAGMVNFAGDPIYHDLTAYSLVAAGAEPEPEPGVPGVGLTASDLAYMRETQAEHRPTEAELQTKTEVPDGMGGRTEAWSPGEPIMVRLDGAEEPPSDVASVAQGPLTKVTLDLVEVRSGDRIEVSPTEAYLVVTDGDTDRWQTAQVAWARRITFPPRA